MNWIFSRARAIRAWVAVLAVGLVLTGVYFIMPGEYGHASIYSVIGITSATVILIRARTMSTGRLPWLVLGFMQLLWAVGDLIWVGYELAGVPPPYPSIADGFYLAAYPIGMVGFVLYVRRRAGRHSSGVIKDATIFALLAGLSGWQLVVQPYIEASGLLNSGDLVGISYPIMDVLLLAVSAALFVGPGANSVSNRFLLIGVAGVLFGDMMYSYGLLNGSYHEAIWYDAAWLLGYVLFAAAACHPSADAHDQDQSFASFGRRLNFIFIAGFATIGVLTLQHIRGHEISPLLILVAGGGSFLFALTRITSLYRESRIQVAAALASEAKYHSLLDHASDAIFIVENGRYVDLNNRACELTGHTRDVLLSTPVGALSPQDERGLLAEGIELARTGETVVQECHVIHKDGSPIIVEASGRMLPDGRYQSIVRDIRDRRASEDALRHNEELLRKVFDSGISGIAVGTSDWSLLRVNKTFASMLGYEPGEMVGMSVQAFIHPDEVEAGLTRLEGLIEGTLEEARFERRYLHREGHVVWANVSLVVMHDEKGEDLIVSHVLDISHSKVLEESLRQAQMMEAVGQLAGGVAHDFNNLLSVIQSFTRFVYDDLDAADSNRRDLEEVLKAGERGARLVRQLLTLARREHPAAEVFEVNDLMNDMTALLRRTIPESVSLTVLLSQDAPHVDMDRSQLEQIILNLAVNARDAMPAGGHLTFGTDVMELTPETGDLAQVEPGEYVRLRAKDDGIGMSSDVRRRIFEPFFSTKEMSSGTGLGLSTVYGIVVGAGGGIVVDSETDQGATFDIYLPSVGHRPEERFAPEVMVRPEGENSWVLVVDDEDAVRNIVQRILETDGYRVLPASNLSEALEIADHLDRPIEAVVADVVMPNGSGLELVEQLRLKRPGLPALFITGYSGDELAGHGLGSEVRYVGKPFNPKEILDALSEVIGYEVAQ
jgi:two-component system, cell cycle sensor histidine kinase and response regulator CckA